MCRICCSPLGNLGNHAGRLAVDKPFTGSPRVLLITTQGRPAHLTCGQNDSVYHNPPAQGRGEKGNYSLFPVKMHRSNPRATTAIPEKGGSYGFGLSWRFSEICCKQTYLVARSGRNVPAWLVFDFQATRRTFLFPRSPHSPGKRPDCDMKLKKLKISFLNVRCAA